ncbi:MAG: EI24 domain-containing protein [Opitutae bacterium]
MKKVIRDYSLAISQLQDPRLWKPVLWATLLSLGTIFVIIVVGGAFLFKSVNSFAEQLSGWISWADGWISGMAVVLGTFFIGALGYFFLSSVYAAFLGLFLDDALDAVREKHYPEVEWMKPPGLVGSSIASIRFILWSLVVYIIASPILLIGYFLPPIGLIVQFLLGGYLLGREFGQLIEVRLPRDQRIKKPGSTSHGTLAIFLWTCPLINLLSPLVLAVSLVHYRLGNKEKKLDFAQIN